MSNVAKLPSLSNTYTYAEKSYTIVAQPDGFFRYEFHLAQFGYKVDSNIWGEAKTAADAHDKAKTRIRAYLRVEEKGNIHHVINDKSDDCA